MIHLFLLDVFQMTAIALVLVINHYPINAYVCFNTTCSIKPIYALTATRVQIFDETDSISHSTNTLGMNPIILPPAMLNSRAD